VLQALPEQAVIDGFKGCIDYYLWKGKPCVRSWPSSPGKNRSPAVKEQWSAFTTASRLWNDLSPDVQRAYNSMAQHGGLSGRDLAMRAYLKGLFTYPTGP